MIAADVNGGLDLRFNSATTAAIRVLTLPGCPSADVRPRSMRLPVSLDSWFSGRRGNGLRTVCGFFLDSFSAVSVLFPARFGRGGVGGTSTGGGSAKGPPASCGRAVWPRGTPARVDPVRQ